jgi:hypothetical protein
LYSQPQRRVKQPRVSIADQSAFDVAVPSSS